jgi:hypothetical protein
MDIIEPTIDFNLNIYLSPPASIGGGAFFTRTLYGTNKSIFVQSNKVLTKNGLVRSGKKMYADLMFDNNSTIFIQWIETFESMCQDKLFQKGESWFETKLEKDDIESAFTSALKIYRSGKYYLMRVNVKPNIKIYNELGNLVDLESITNETYIIPILEIQGIKFSSRNFQMEIELKQAMVVSADPFLDKCFIKKSAIGIDIDNKNNNDIPICMNDVETHDLPIPVDEKECDVDLNQLLEDELTKQEDNNNNNMQEYDLQIEEFEQPQIELELKKPNQVYYEMYLKAKEKAINLKHAAMEAIAEMKQIKETYLLEDTDDEDFGFE